MRIEGVVKWLGIAVFADWCPVGIFEENANLAYKPL